MEIRLKTGNSIKNISIINTYAPHIGYPTEIIEEYWKYIEAYTSLIPNNLIKIWCTDNNGQLSRNETNQKYIGKWTMGNKLENLNSQKLSMQCIDNEMVACNTYFIPKDNDKSNLATWYSYTGEVQKQLDYILIEHRYRNWAKNVTNDTIANINSPMQHRALILDLKITLKANYFTKKQDVSCPYDLNKARANPNLICEEIENLNLNNIPIQNLWSSIQGSTLEILIKNYPRKDLGNPKINSNNSTNKIIKQANYELFDLIKSQAKLLKNKRMQSFWADWKDMSHPNHLRYDGNIWNHQIKNNYNMIKNVTRYIKNQKEEAKIKRQEENDMKLKAHISQIKKFRQNGDLPSVLKEFKRFSKKPFVSITELKGNDGINIADPDEIRKKIDLHIEEILNDPKLNPDDDNFQTHLTETNIANNMISCNNDQAIADSNEKRRKSKLWYFLNKNDKTNYSKFLTNEFDEHEIRKAILHQQNARAIGTDHIPPLKLLNLTLLGSRNF